MADFSGNKTQTLWRFASVIIFAGCFLYYYNVPLWGDDWFYGTVREFQEIYSLKKGWHPGRQITEFLHIFPSRILGTLLGFTIGNPLLGVRIAHGLTGAAISLGLYSVATWYTPKKFRSYAFVLFALSSIYFNKYFVEFTITSQIWGGLLFSLITWSPLAHFFLHGSLPRFFEDDPRKAFGVWLAFIYMGTQVFDVSSWLIAGLSVFTLFFLHCNADKISYSHKTLVRNLAIAIVLFAIFALFRDTVLSEYGQYRLAHSLNIKFVWFLEAPIYIKGGLILGLYFLVKYTLINLRNGFSQAFEFYQFSLFAVGYGVLLFSAVIIATYADGSIYIIGIGFANVLADAYNRRQRLALYLFPTLILGLAVGSVNAFDRTSGDLPVSRREFITQRINERTITLYQKAEGEGKAVLEVPESLADEMRLVFRVPPVWMEYMSIWMKMYGYTQKVIPVVIVPDPPANEKTPEIGA